MVTVEFGVCVRVWRGLSMREWDRLSLLQEYRAVSRDTRVHDLGWAAWLTVPASFLV